MIKSMVFLTAAILLLFSGCATKETETAAVKEPNGQEVPAYYYAPFVDGSIAREKLEQAGFDIVATYAPTENSETIVITNSALKAAANKPGRGFAAILRVLVDREHQRIAYTNPVYFGKAFLQGEYDHAVATAAENALATTFEGAEPSKDVMNYDELIGYNFMVGMPYYKDTELLGEGEQGVLLSKLAEYKEGKKAVFRLELDKARTLVGFDLSKRTKRFLKKIGTQNAEMLPYTILVEDGKATALSPEYYIAISYPLLSMGGFMNIATVPGAIEKELRSPFE